MRSEQDILRISISVTTMLAAFGIIVGIWSGSSAITFDGVYSLIDAGMTMVALLVARLIGSSNIDGAIGYRLSKRFTMGFWHLEPMVLGLNGTLLMGAAIYALIDSIGNILAGGHRLIFDHAIIYAVVTLIVTIAMTIFGKWANLTIKSEFVALDTKAWMITASLTAALLVAFLFGSFVQQTTLQWLTPYIDPAILAVICVLVIPIPAGTVKQALSDILLVTPTDFKLKVDKAAERAVARYGFLYFRAYVAKVGRGRQVELHFVGPRGWPGKTLEDWDLIRDEIGVEIGEEGADRWLTIVFTADPAWAD